MTGSMPISPVAGASQKGFVLPAFPSWSPLSSPAVFSGCLAGTPQNSTAVLVCHSPKGVGEQQRKPGNQKEC